MKTNFLTAIALSALIGFTSCKKKEDVVIIDDTTSQTDPTKKVSGSITSNTTWTADKIYILDGKVVVTGGATLTIEPGTIIKAKEGTNTLAAALVIAKDGKINANGTAASPIIFTTILDNIKIGDITGTNLTETDRGKWGGLVVLGNAPVSADGSDVSAQIEGIPATEAYGNYGGSDSLDNSGVLNYISIRHGGALIGSGNELNGLTLGGVGAGTTITNIEIVANVDDGIEFFGGTVNLTNALVYFQDDDAYDIDMNYSGTITNVMAIHGGTGTDEAFEIDGPEGSTYTSGLFTINNATAISLDGNGSGADLKSKAQGTLNNIYFEGYSTFIKVRENYDENNSCAEKTDAYDKLVTDNKLFITNCIFNGANDLADAVNAYTAVTTCASNLDAADQTALDTKVSTMTGNSTTGTTGVDASVFNNWTWASANNKL